MDHAASLELSSTEPRLARLVVAAQRLFSIPSLFVLFLVTFEMRHWLQFEVYVPLALGMIVAAYLGLERSDYKTFVLYILFFNLFNGLRILADGAGMPVSFAYPAQLDHAIFGANPSAWLQSQFYTDGKLGPLDYGTLAVYTTYFTGHFVLAVLVWLFAREHLQTFITAIIITLYVGLGIYFLVPTAPPWLAAEHGDTPPIVRIASSSSNEDLSSAYSRGARFAGENDVAAMPSLHSALTVVIALVGWRLKKVLGILGGLYALAMGFSLVYLGEHYVVDALAGAAVAIAGYKLAVGLAERQTEPSSVASRQIVNEPA